MFTLLTRRSCTRILQIMINWFVITSHRPTFTYIFSLSWVHFYLINIACLDKYSAWWYSQITIKLSASISIYNFSQNTHPSHVHVTYYSMLRVSILKVIVHLLYISQLILHSHVGTIRWDCMLKAQASMLAE